MRTLSACLLVFASATLVVSCVAPPPSASLWPTNIVNGIADHADPRLSNANSPRAHSPESRQPIRLAAANNETLGFPFAVRAPAPLPSPALRITEFQTAGGPEVLLPSELFRIHGVEVRSFPGWHIRSLPPNRRNTMPMDVLVPINAPRGGLPTALESQQVYWFWADLAVPTGTDGGVYTGVVELSAAGIPAGTIPIELTVWPFVLPDESSPPLIAEFDHAAVVREFAAAANDRSINAEHWHDHGRGPEITESIHATLRMLQRHRLSPILSGLAPRATMSARSEITLDWRQFDAVMGPVMNGEAFDNRMPLPAIIVPVPESVQANAARSGGEAVLREYFSQFAAHFQQMGWSDRAFAIAPAGPPDTSLATREAARDHAALIAMGTAGKIRAASPLIPQDMSRFGWYGFPHTDLDDDIAIWFPPAQYFDFAEAQRRQDRGEQVWLWVDRPPYSGIASVHAAEADVRAIAWQAKLAQADAIYIAGVNKWPALCTSAAACIAANPAALLYPGSEFGLPTPVPSVRLKHLRRGMQDAAYLKLLDNHRQEHIGRAVVSALVSGVGTSAYRAHFADGKPPAWIADPAAYELAREVVAGELIKSAYGQQPTEREDFSRSAAWLRLMDEGRRVRLHSDGFRVRPFGSTRDPEADLQLTVTVENATRVPLSGQITVVDPPGFSAVAVDGLRPATEQTVRLSARENLRRLLAGGTRDTHIELTTGSGARWKSIGRLALTAAAPVSSPIRIDGDLSDWPASANVLADFRSVASSPDADASRSPRQATSAFVLRDDQAVYFAIRCDASEAHARPPARKHVTYDDMVPVGEDLIEILLDPDNLGTRDPADLYHIAVKRSGADLVEKGFTFDPPWCRRETWAADIDAAVTDSGRQWVAEVRIPFDAFSPGPHRNEVWGLNITRFDPAHQEFSTWSGAVGNAYDPLSLGNLYLP